ncbi:CorA family divalent cation transporter (plasmid) [Novosphingobium resinovorum]|uniref:CorA family divalent cation transporter n=1 Tax=Novosphingobium TaxID=165696 RepID=UPI001B3C772B|nr:MULTISPECIES: CorA family divalent cation transporter [Novosphingobium]MBF7015567.1 magnesium transporter [Novosphingobium sp. HR1a]WJM30242.1 CorA family divalent cation transporter [Novosphingobium resinovorum]
MLRSFPEAESGASGVWIDLLSPDPDERSIAEQRCGLKLPAREALSEIQASSRLRADGDVLYMSAALISGTGAGEWSNAPTGFILTPDTLITVRYDYLEPFDAVGEKLRHDVDVSAASVLATLLEDIVGRAADHLEQASAVVSKASQLLFIEEEERPGLKRETRKIRLIMRDVGRASDQASRVRYAFLSLGRMVSFILDRCTPDLDQLMQERFDSIRHDINSLDEFETSLEGRIQLLQDAAAAFLSIEQNDVVKVLTVASVVGVPPVLVVGVYGMNFRNMPELSWELGYPYALILCLVSGLLPYLWFKWRGWI